MPPKYRPLAMVKVGLLPFGDDNGRGLLASGELGGLQWHLWHIEQFGSDGPILVFTAQSNTGLAAADSCFGMARLERAGSLVVGVSAAVDQRFVWGLASRDAEAISVLDEAGASHDAPVGGISIDGLEPFVVVVDAIGIPAQVQAMDRSGVVTASQSFRPVPSTDTGLASRLQRSALTESFGHTGQTVVAVGRVDGQDWWFTADRRGNELTVGMTHMGLTGGGSSSSTGPVPQPTRACRVGISGSGSSYECWNLHGWAAPEVDRLVLHFRSGDAVELPLGGGKLQLGVSLFGIALPNDVLGHTLEAYDRHGVLIDRCWLASALAMTDASIQARA